MRSIITAPRTPFAWAVAILFAVSAVALAWTAFKSVLVLKPRRYQTPSTEQLCEEWEQYKASGHLSPEGVVELVSKQLIEGSAGKVSPLKSIRADADSRSENFSGAIRAALTSTVMIALVLVMVAFHEATAKEATNGNREATTATTAKTNPPTTAVPSRTK